MGRPQSVVSLKRVYAILNYGAKPLTPKEKLIVQVTEVYKLWKRAMEGDWEVYFRYFAFTVDEHEEDKDIRKAKPLVNDDIDASWIIPFVKEILESEQQVIHIVKSRQQRVSWIMTHVCLYQGLVHSNWLIPLQSTKKTNKADELFDKQQKSYDRLPVWKISTRINKRDGHANLGNQTKFLMMSEDTDDAAGFTFNMFYFDEMSLHKKAKKVFGVCLPGLGVGHGSTERKFISSSSPRLGSYHVEMSIDEFIEKSRKWIIYRDWSKKGLSVGMNKRGHKVIELHYSANPSKDHAWMEREKPNYEEDVWEREYELNPDAVDGSKVFRSFNKSMIKPELVLMPNVPIIRSWDFGACSACTLAQYDEKRKTYKVYREIYQDHSDADRFVRAVNAETTSFIPASFHSYIVDCCDPYQGPQKNYLTGGNSVMFEVEDRMKKLCKKIIRFKTLPRHDIEFRLNISRAVMRQGFETDESCHILNKGFRGGYILKPGTSKPKKDGYFEHLMDALMYGQTLIFNIGANRGLIHLPQQLLTISPYTETVKPIDIIEGVVMVEHTV